MSIPAKKQANQHQDISELRDFYECLLGLSKDSLLETTFESLEKELNISIFSLFGRISKLVKIGVIESFLNTRAYDKNDKRIFIGFAHSSIVDDLFREGAKK